MNLTEKRQNLFTVDDRHVLAHCISVDCAMNAGIARDFTRYYPHMRDTIRNAEPSLYNAVPYIAPDGKKIYNLVTKTRYFEKPTWESLRYTLIDMCNQMKFRDEHYLAMPRIGCGLDRLIWRKVREEIECIFGNDDVSIWICYI